MRTHPFLYGRGFLVVAGLALVGVACAQLKVTGPGTQVIDFEGSLGYDDGIADNDVMKSSLREGTLQIFEPDTWDYHPANTGAKALASAAWAYKWQAQDDPFGDFNNNGNLGDRRDTWQTEGVTGSTLPAIGAGNHAVRFMKDTWDDKSLTLRILNGSGAAISNWAFSVDAWYNDEALNFGTLNLLASKDLSNWSSVASLASTNSGAGWSGKTLVGGSLNLNVNAGEYVYLRMNYDQDGRGNEFVFDNVTVTTSVVPEPATLAVLGLGTLLLARRRR